VCLAIFRAFKAVDEVRSDTQMPASQHKEFDANMAALVGAFMKDPGDVSLYKCHWDNTDDTDADALMSFDFKSGFLRVLLAFAGA
jgi:hypothetical protein